MTDDYIDTPEKAAARLKKIRLLLTEADIPIVGDYREREIEYIDPAPKPLIVQIPLIEYFERMKRHKADRWQHDFCRRLQEAAENRHIKGVMQEYHAEPRLGKTSILSQTFPAWLFGHDPLFRYALAMYNITQSQSHSDVIIQMMRSPMHKDIFPSKDGHLPSSVSKAGWMTNARRDAENGQMDGQKSLNPVGLESGLTGGGMDWLSIDDPYKDPKEAFSETMWTNLDRFWRFGVQSRISPFTCVASMFHRYSESDFGGYLLDTGEFEYIRYATILEKPEDLVYFHEATGQQFVDPLGRGVGEYISERRGESYYAKNRKDAKVWNSMFIGVPRTDETDFFHAQKIEIITDVDQALVEWNLCISKGRGWDNAATEGAGDYSASALAGIQADGTLVFGDATMEQLDTGSRVTQQQTLAAEDGIDVAICIPEDKAASGKDVVFFTTQALRGYTIIPRAVSNSTIGSTAKARRAYNLSTMVNTGRVKFLHLKRETQPASYVPGGWVKSMQRAMQGFMQGGNDDIIDAAADVTNHLIEDFYKGLVVKNLSPQRNLVTWDTFGKYYGPKGDDQQPLSEIPKHWTIYVGVKITPEASKANSAIIVARAAQNAKLPDTLFIVAEYKKFDANYEAVFDWIDAALEAYCGGNKNAMIWLHADSEQYRQTIAQKLKRSVLVFEGEGGLTELNWYLKPNGKDHPFSEVKQEGANLYGLIADPHQLMAATDEYGLYAVRQEASTWGFTEKGEPSAVGSVLDCLSMICYAFRTSETGLTVDEKVEEAIKVKSPNLQLSVINAMPDQDQRDTATTKRMMEEKRIRQEMNLPVRGAHANRFARR